MTPRYAPRAFALALLALAPAALRAQTAETWRFTRTITFPVAGADTARVRPFLAATAADGTLYVISSRSTDVLAENALWKAAPGASSMTLVEAYADTNTVYSTRGVATIGNDVYVSTILSPKVTQVGTMFRYPNGDVATKRAFNSAAGNPGYGTNIYALAGTSSGYLYSTLSFQTSMRVYNFSDPTASNYGAWVGMNPTNRTEDEGHDQCGLAALRDIATVPGKDYTTDATAPFYTVRNASPATLPQGCGTRYEGGIAVWTGGTAVAPGPADGQGYAAQGLADFQGYLSGTSFITAGITADSKGRLWATGPDSSKRWVKVFEPTGTFATEAFELPSSTSLVTPVAGGAPFKAPADVALNAAETIAYVMDRNARRVFVFTKEGTAAERPVAPGGLALTTTANPVRGRTLVRFALGTPGEARLAAYDALGRQVAVVAAGRFGAEAQTATFETAGLPAGVYTLRLTAGGAVATKAVVVVQ